MSPCLSMCMDMVHILLQGGCRNAGLGWRTTLHPSSEKAAGSSLVLLVEVVVNRKQFKGQLPKSETPRGSNRDYWRAPRTVSKGQKVTWNILQSVSFSSPLGNLDIKEHLSYCTLPPYLSELQQNSLPTRTAGTIACPWQWLSIDPSGQS